MKLQLIDRQTLLSNKPRKPQISISLLQLVHLKLSQRVAHFTRISF